MSADQGYYIPRTLDDPPLLLIFEADTAGVFLVWMLMGALMQTFFFGLFLAVICSRTYARIKNESGEGTMLKVCYWYGASDMFSKNLPAYARERIG